MRNRVEWRGVAALAVGVSMLSACATNPATGKRQISVIGEEREIEMGREADQEISASMGIYDDEGLTAYVDAIGQTLAASSERPHLPWTFRVVDDAAVNAFALPGGFIYVTRGILAHMNSEAELAGVLGHEIGHVTGRHSVNRLSKAQIGGTLMSVGTVVAAVAAPNYAGLVDTGAQLSFALAFSKFSRDHERQADDLGLRYMTRATYDPREMPGVFEMLEAVSSRIEGGRAPDWLATHPNPEARGRRSVAAIEALGDDLGGRVGADDFIRQLEDLPFGANPREGYFRESLFLHPDMKFQFAFPQGWKTQNGRTQVVAINPEGDVGILLSLSEGASAQEGATRFLDQEGIEAGRRWTKQVNGLTASGAGWKAESGEVTYEGDVVCVEHGGVVFQLLSYGLEDNFARERSVVNTSLKSFRKLTDPAVLAVEPFRVEVVRVTSPITLRKLAELKDSPVSIETLEIANRRGADEPIPAGSTAKIVVGKRWP